MCLSLQAGGIAWLNGHASVRGYRGWRASILWPPNSRDVVRSPPLRCGMPEASTSWPPTRRIEREVRGGLADNLFFVFVCLNDLGAASFHVVSRKTVSEYCSRSTRDGLRCPGEKAGSTRTTPCGGSKTLRVGISTSGGRWGLARMSSLNSGRLQRSDSCGRHVSPL